MDAGDDAHFIAGDVTSRATCEAIVNGTVERFGRIDILFANAGGAANHAPVVDLTDEAGHHRAVGTHYRRVDRTDVSRVQRWDLVDRG